MVSCISMSAHLFVSSLWFSQFWRYYRQRRNTVYSSKGQRVDSRKVPPGQYPLEASKSLRSYYRLLSVENVRCRKEYGLKNIKDYQLSRSNRGLLPYSPWHVMFKDIALIHNNAKVGSQIACALSKQMNEKRSKSQAQHPGKPPNVSEVVSIKHLCVYIFNILIKNESNKDLHSCTGCYRRNKCWFYCQRENKNTSCKRHDTHLSRIPPNSGGK